MKTLKKLAILLILLIFVSCGSSERVITNQGKVYEVKGSKIENNGVEVTDSLSKTEKESINNLIKKKKEAKKVFEAQQNELEAAITEQENIQKRAKEKQEELEDKLDALEGDFEEKQDAKENFASIKMQYNKQKNKFKKLKKEGELSTKDIKDWRGKLSTLKQKVKKAKNEINK